MDWKQKKALGDLALTVAAIVAVLVGGFAALVLVFISALGRSSGSNPLTNVALPILLACGFCGLLILLRAGGSMPAGRTIFLSVVVIVLIALLLL